MRTPRADCIALIGFMGSGKSTVGRLLAERLGWDFVDTDAWVEEARGSTVAEIFRQRGERAFRALEAGALESLRGRSRLVVATGGGAPAEPGNRWFFERAAVFHLRVSLPSMRERTSGNRDRPLLALGESQLGALYESRRPIYEALGRGVDTDGRSPPDVAAEILDILRGPGGLMDPTRRRLEDSGGQGPSA